MNQPPTAAALLDQMMAAEVERALGVADAAVVLLAATDGRTFPAPFHEQGAGMINRLDMGAYLVAHSMTTDHPQSLWMYLVGCEVLNGPVVA